MNSSYLYQIKNKKSTQLSHEEVAKMKHDLVRSKWNFMLPFLDATGGKLCNDIAREIRNGIAPTGRAVWICSDIYARTTTGNDNTDEYHIAVSDFIQRIT